MRALTKQEVITWCEGRSIGSTSSGHLYFDQTGPHSLLLTLPTKPYQILYLAWSLLPRRTDGSLDSALLWICQRDIWTEEVERLGERVFDDLRTAWGIKERLADRPGQIYPPEQSSELWMSFVVPMLFGWDAFMVPASQEYFVFNSHDEVISVVTRTEELCQELLRGLENWKPQLDNRWYFKPPESQ